MRKRLVAAALVAVMAAPVARAGDTDDIRQLMMATFDKPEAPLTVEPITVQEDIAIAGWAQGDMGGRALLRKDEDGWALSLCAGDALTEADSLEQLGLPPAEAAALATAVVAAEAPMDPSLTAKFSRFEGMVMMDGDGDHPPAHAHGAADGG